MNWKKFLLDWKKLVLTVALIIITSLPIENAIFQTTYGFPFVFYTVGINLSNFIYLNLIFNLIIWYVVSCLIILIYNKVKK